MTGDDVVHSSGDFYKLRDEPEQDVTNLMKELRCSTVIRVIGSLDSAFQKSKDQLGVTPEDLGTVLKKFKLTRDSVRQVISQKEFSVDEKSNRGVDDTVKRELREDHRQQMKLIHQYLTTAIVAAARKHRSLVLCDDTKIAQLISEGCSRTQLSSEDDPMSLLEIKRSLEQKRNVVAKNRNTGITEVQAVGDEGVLALVSKFVACVRNQKRLNGGFGAGEIKGRFVAYILVGGHESENRGIQLEILHAVKQDWPLFVVENSGGYAEYLSSIFRRIESISPNPSIDDFRSILASGDPVAAEILINGKNTIVGVGTEVDVFQHELQLGLADDETIHQAWMCFAHWDHNAQLYAMLTNAFQITILFLGILTTTLTIVQCFLQLLYPNILDSVEILSEEKIVRGFMLGNNLALIILPVLTSLFQAVLFKLDPAQRWVTLRRCSQLMLREIYLFRTETRNYSSSAVTKQRAKLIQHQERNAEPNKKNNNDSDSDVGSDSSEENDVVGGKSGVDEKILETWDTEGYLSPQDLLFQRIEALSNEISTAMSDTPMRHYDGPMPPTKKMPALTGEIDDGFSRMQPEQYIKFRLETQLKLYIDSSTKYTVQFRGFTYAIYVFGSIGTMLAAFAVYGDVKQFNLQFWVALTTSVQNALSRFLDYSRVEFLMQEHNKAKEGLDNVRHWWSQLQQPGIQVDSQAHRDVLVGKVETCISREVEESGSQLKNLASRIRKSQEQQAAETQTLVSNLQANTMSNSVKELEAMGVQVLSRENIDTALGDPSSAISVEILQVINRIEELNSNRPQDDETLEKAIEEQKERFKDVESLLQSGIENSDVPPADVVNIVMDPKLQPRLAEVIAQQKTSTANRPNILQILELTRKELRTRLAQIPQRNMLSVLRSMLEELVIRKFEDSLHSINVSLYDLVGTRKEAEQLIGELGAVVACDWKQMGLGEILKLVRDEDINAAVSKLKESTIRAMLKRAERFFSSSCADGDSAAGLLKSVLSRIAVLDVDELLADPHSVLERAKIRSQEKHSTSLLSKSKTELLRLLPPGVRSMEDICKQSKRQLAAYIEEIIMSGTEFELMDFVCNKGALGPKSAEGQARFFFAVCDLPINSIFNTTSDVILRQMSVSPYFTPSFANELRAEPKLGEWVNRTRTAISRSYGYRMFKLLCEAAEFRDLEVVFSTFHDRVSLVEMVSSQLYGENFSTSPVTEILLSLTPRIAKLLKALPNVDQIQSLVGTLMRLVASPFAFRFVHEVAQQEKVAAMVKSWSRAQCQRLVFLSTQATGCERDRVVLAGDIVVDRMQRDLMRPENPERIEPTLTFIQTLIRHKEPMIFDLVAFIMDNFKVPDDVFREVVRLLASHMKWGVIASFCGAQDGKSTLWQESNCRETKPVALAAIADHIDQEMVVRGPLIVFDALVERCHTVPLYDLFQKYSEVYTLIKLLSILCATDSLRALESTKKVLINEAMKSVVNEPIVQTLRRFTEADANTVVSQFAELWGENSLVATWMSSFPQTLYKRLYAEERQTDGTDSSKPADEQRFDQEQLRRVHTRCAAYYVRTMFLYNRKMVEENFFHFDVNAYFATLQEERFRRVCEVIDEESVAMSFVNLPSEETKLFFDKFQELRNVLVFERDDVFSDVTLGGFGSDM